MHFTVHRYPASENKKGARRGARGVSGTDTLKSRLRTAGVMSPAFLQMKMKNCTFTPLVAREEALLQVSPPPRQLLPGQDWCKVHMRSCP